jgi:uncharacterized membrane protein
MNALAVAWGIGAVSGSRSMLGPAVVARHVLPPVARSVFATLAAGELVADKSARIGNRTDPLPLAGRLLLGGIAAATYAPRRQRMQAALAGAAGALAAAYACYHLRRVATQRFGVPDAVAGLVEDAVAIGAGAALLKQRVT